MARKRQPIERGRAGKTENGNLVHRASCWERCTAKPPGARGLAMVEPDGSASVVLDVVGAGLRPLLGIAVLVRSA